MANIKQSELKKNIVSIPEVVAFLKQQIKKGNLAPGQRLVEADITRDTGASRSRVRAAFQQMAAEGLITIEEFRGAAVKRYTLEEVTHLYMVRKVLEGLATHTITKAADPIVLRKIRDIQEKMNLSEKNHNNAEFARLNNEWHSTIVAASNNTYIIEFLDRLKIPIFRYLHNMFYEGSVVENANKEHKKITEAILSGDAGKAEKLMQKHIESALLKIERDNDETFTTI